MHSIYLTAMFSMNPTPREGRCCQTRSTLVKAKAAMRVPLELLADRARGHSRCAWSCVFPYAETSAPKGKTCLVL